MRVLRFLGTAKNDLSEFPEAAKSRAGYELFMVQVGREPDDWKPMNAVGRGVKEIRIRDASGAFRVLLWRNLRMPCTCCTVFRRRHKRRARRTWISPANATGIS